MSFESICFIDTETKGGEPSPFDDVSFCGAARYFETANTIMITYAIDEGPVRIIDDWDGVSWKDLPEELTTFWWETNVNHDLGPLGRKIFAAWNAGFDRDALSYGVAGVPAPLRPKQFIDVMAQAVASNLPPALEGASRSIGRGGKQQDGKELIKRFTPFQSDWNPTTHPGEWNRFCTYAGQDIDEMREVYFATRPLSDDEWTEYWAAEAVNERGMPIDTHFAGICAAVAEANLQRSNRRIAEITHGKITAVTQIARIVDWVWEACQRTNHSEALEIMTKAVRQDPDNEDDYYVTKKSLKRDRIERMVVYFDQLAEKRDLTDDEWDILDVIEMREWDGSSAPAKFQKMLDQNSDGRLYGSYTFNGAPQTGRFSSRGVQVHNLVNKFIGMEDKKPELEAEAIEDLYQLGD